MRKTLQTKVALVSLMLSDALDVSNLAFSECYSVLFKVLCEHAIRLDQDLEPISSLITDVYSAMESDDDKEDVKFSFLKLFLTIWRREILKKYKRVIV